MTLREQAIFTANALRNMARDANQYAALAQQLNGHADDLERRAQLPARPPIVTLPLGPGDVEGDYAECIANACLIEAAPELLEASKAFLVQVALAFTCGEILLASDPTVESLRAAIAKAEGR